MKEMLMLSNDRNDASTCNWEKNWEVIISESGVGDEFDVYSTALCSIKAEEFMTCYFQVNWVLHLSRFST